MDQDFESSFSGYRIRSLNDPLSHITQVRTIDDQTNYLTFGLEDNYKYTQVDQTASNNDETCIHQSCRSANKVTQNEYTRLNPMNESIRLNKINDNIRLDPMNFLQHRFESQTMAVVDGDFLSSLEVFNKLEIRYRWDDDPFEPCPIRE